MADSPDPYDVPKTSDVNTAQARYTTLATEREPYLIRARRMSKLTIVSLFRESGDNATTDEELPWNSMGAYGVNNLSSKLVLSLFPPGTPFIKLKMDKKALKDLIAANPDPDQQGQLRSVIDLGYSQMEKSMVECMDEDGDRAILTNASRKLLVGGTHGFQFYKDGTTRGIPLDRFVCQRDGAGNLLEFIVVDNLAWATLPEDVKEGAVANGYKPLDDGSKEIIPVYTWGCLCDGVWTIFQEVHGFRVPETQATYNPDAMPFMFVPFLLLEGEHYGRSYVEDYEADLQTVEGNTQAITEAGAAIARYIILVSPTGLTSKKAVAEARNGDTITGREEDVKTLVSNKGGDMQVVMGITQQAADRLTRAFLLAAQARQAERVTAEEIRQTANEVETSLGGVYSQAVITWQAPFAKLKLKYLMVSGRLPQLPAGTTKTQVVAGMAGLGRNAELQALDDFVGGVAQLLGPTAVQQSVNPRVYMNRRGAALHVDTKGLVYSEEEAQQNAQSAAMTNTASQVAPELIKQYGAKQVADTNAQAKTDTAQIQAAATAPAQGAAAPAAPAAPVNLINQTATDLH